MQSTQAQRLDVMPKISSNIVRNVRGLTPAAA